MNKLVTSNDIWVTLITAWPVLYWLHRSKTALFPEMIVSHKIRAIIALNQNKIYLN